MSLIKYAGIIKNDVSAGPGVCVTFFVQGCPIHCPDCHNPEAQDFEGGKEFTQDTINEIVEAITANGITRNFCVMGGEPLCDENAFLTSMICGIIRDKFPDIEIWVWTGYVYEDLVSRTKVQNAFKIITGIVDGPYIASQRDVSLPMHGSSNQRIIHLDDEGKAIDL